MSHYGGYGGRLRKYPSPSVCADNTKHDGYLRPLHQSTASPGITHLVAHEIRLHLAVYNLPSEPEGQVVAGDLASSHRSEGPQHEIHHTLRDLDIATYRGGA
ncbi:hypothetical protein NPX13_g9078 [Xylaria arbuscula]|uniref:Uncharacterized protein n=1 Tax=Xylaria arbuscula TaxID=114810 RepID=A0A9W8TJI4_9PEZI|nr:hypothetical protein NPX13_g9078 [Xylaria arbuscula]